MTLVGCHRLTRGRTLQCWPLCGLYERAVIGRSLVDPRSHRDTPTMVHLLGPSTLVLARTGTDGVPDQCATRVVVVAEVQRQVLAGHHRDRTQQAQLAMKLRLVEMSVDHQLAVRQRVVFRVVVHLRAAAAVCHLLLILVLLVLFLKMTIMVIKLPSKREKQTSCLTYSLAFLPTPRICNLIFCWSLWHRCSNSVEKKIS